MIVQSNAFAPRSHHAPVRQPLKLVGHSLLCHANLRSEFTDAQLARAYERMQQP